MKQSTFKKSSRSGSQEALCYLRSPKAHCRIHKSCHWALSWAKSIHSPPTTQFLWVTLILYPSTSGSSKWHLPFGFSNQRHVCNCDISHECYMPLPSHSSWFPHHDIFIFWIWMKFLVLQPLPSSCYFVPVRPKYSHHNPVCKQLKCTLFPQHDRPRFTPVHNQRWSYRFLHLDLTVLRRQTVSQQIHKWEIATFPECNLFLISSW